MPTLASITRLYSRKNPGCCAQPAKNVAIAATSARASTVRQGRISPCGGFRRNMALTPDWPAGPRNFKNDQIRERLGRETSPAQSRLTLYCLWPRDCSSFSFSAFENKQPCAAGRRATVVYLSGRGLSPPPPSSLCPSGTSHSLFSFLCAALSGRAITRQHSLFVESQPHRATRSLQGLVEPKPQP